MVEVIDMQRMRYLNLFEKISKVRTRFCFIYNETIFFCVPKRFMSKAIGEKAKNIKKLNEILRKKIKIIVMPETQNDIEKFFEAIVSPVVFKNFEIKDKEVIVSASKQSKAALFGRNKKRFHEMQEIMKNFFNKEFKIV